MSALKHEIIFKERKDLYSENLLLVPQSNNFINIPPYLSPTASEREI